MIVEAREDNAKDQKIIVKKYMELGMEKMVLEVLFILEPEIRDTWGNYFSSRDSILVHEIFY